MKKLSNLETILSIIVLAIFLTSCDDDKYSGTDTTITALAQSTPSLSVLVQALVKTNLASTLQGSGPYTVFAPTDAAFTAFLKTTPYATLNDVPNDVLTQILLNHVVSGSLTSKMITSGYIKTLAKGTASSTNNLNMFVSTANGVRLNGVSTVRTEDVMASNGVIHIVDAVINLPTVITHARANPSFSSLVGALTATGQPDFVGTLSGTGPFTVFVPTNDAFTALNTELAPGGTASVSVANMTKVLNYHVANGNVLASTLMEGQIVSTRETPQTLKIELVGGPKIRDARSRVSNIIVTDVQCANGVIHVVNRVLLPTF